MYQVVTVLHVDPTRIELLREAAPPSIEATRAQQGNEHYEFFYPEGRDDTIVIIERWQDKSCFEKHVELAQQEGDEVFEFGKVLGPSFTSEPDVFEGLV